MFSSTDFFHFVFANLNDEYYTSSLLKMDFDTYLWYCLTEDRYKCIAHVKKLRTASGYVMEYTGIKKSRLELERKKKPLFSGFGGLFGAKKDEEEMETHLDPSVVRASTDPKTWEEMVPYILNIIELMKNDSNMVLAMSVADFDMLCSDRKVVSDLITLKKNGGSNIMVLYSGVNAVENDKYFVYDAASPSVFYQKDNRELFSDLYYKFNPGDTDEQQRRIMTYGLLKTALGSRMQVWNEFTEERVRNAVKYASMRTTYLSGLFEPSFTSFVIRAFYANDAFYEKYKTDAPLTDNKRRMFSELTNCIGKKKFRLWLEDISRTERTEDADELSLHWMIDDNYAYIGYFSDGYSEPAIVKMMEKFRNLVRGHESGVMDEDRLGRLEEMIAYFKKPAYRSRFLKDELMCEMFQHQKNNNLINNVLVRLAKKKEWNSWDEGCAETLYALFDLSTSQAESYCDGDFYNELGKAQFNMGMNMLSYAFESSITRSHMHDEGCKVNRITIETLYSGDNKAIKQFRYSDEVFGINN